MFDFLTGFLFGIGSISGILVVAALLGKGKPVTPPSEPKPDPAYWWRDGGRPSWETEDDAE